MLCILYGLIAEREREQCRAEQKREVERETKRGHGTEKGSEC